MYCDRCWEDRSIIHTCTPCREYMLDIIQKEIWSEYSDIFVDWTQERWYYPVMIWDVLDRAYNWLNTQFARTELYKRLIYKSVDTCWKNMRRPIQYQSDECIRYIYSLLPSEVRK